MLEQCAENAHRLDILVSARASAGLPEAKSSARVASNCSYSCCADSGGGGVQPRMACGSVLWHACMRLAQSSEPLFMGEKAALPCAQRETKVWVSSSMR